MNISKALKVKNRLAGKLAQLQTVAASSNSVRDDQKNYKSIDLVSVWEDLTKTHQILIQIKSDIAKATAPIVGKLVALAEAKAELSFLNSIFVNESEDMVRVGFGADSSLEKIAWSNHIDAADKQSLIDQVQKKIETLQDDIDVFNAATTI